MRVEVAAQHLLRRGQRAVDALALVGVAGGFHLSFVAELHFIHYLQGSGGRHRLRVAVEVLSPNRVFPAGLQLMSYFTAPQLVFGYLLALCCAAGVEVVAVVDGGVGGEGVATGGGVVRADVEAVGQGASVPY